MSQQHRGAMSVPCRMMEHPALHPVLVLLLLVCALLAGGCSGRTMAALGEAPVGLSNPAPVAAAVQNSPVPGHNPEAFAIVRESRRVEAGVLPAVTPPMAKVAEASSPHTAAPASPVARDQVFTLHFPTGRSLLADELHAEVAAIARLLQAQPEARAVIEGHSDARGDAENNKLLSYQRALAVQIALLSRHGIAADRMEVKGLGQDFPVADNATVEGRGRNRRVCVRLELPETPGVQTAELVRLQTQSPVQGASTAAATGVQAPALQAGEGPLALVFGAPSGGRLQAKSRGTALAAGVPGATVSYAPLHQAAPRSRTPQQFRIEISVSKCTLWLYEIMSDGSKRLVRPYQVATAKRGTAWPRGMGQVVGVDFDPWWYPPETALRNARQLGKRLVPVPPGASDNPMGAFKIILSHQNDGGAYRIHGTNQPWQIGKRVSLGCIRMHNDEGVELARMLPVGTEVDIQY